MRVRRAVDGEDQQFFTYSSKKPVHPAKQANHGRFITIYNSYEQESNSTSLHPVMEIYIAMTSTMSRMVPSV